MIINAPGSGAHVQSIPGPGKWHKAYEGNGALRIRVSTGCDLVDNGELLWCADRPQRHDESTTHFELLNERRRHMVKSSRHDRCIERTTFRPSEITVSDLDTDIVVAEFSQHFRSSFGQRWDNLNGTDLCEPDAPVLPPGNLTPCQLGGLYRLT